MGISAGVATVASLASAGVSAFGSAEGGVMKAQGAQEIAQSTAQGDIIKAEGISQGDLLTSQYSAAGAQFSAAGVAAGDTYKASELDRTAQYGNLQAVQTGGQLTQNLNITLGNIDATRAAAHADPTSPTGAAVRGYAENIGTQQKDIEVGSIEEQATQNESDAAYLRYSANQALLSGDVQATGDLLAGNIGSQNALTAGQIGASQALLAGNIEAESDEFSGFTTAASGILGAIGKAGPK